MGCNLSGDKKQYCGVCKFFRLIHKRKNSCNYGRCHRFPPSEKSFFGWDYHVVVFDDDWCGEFKDKKSN